jgi:hypothetical protein
LAQVQAQRTAQARHVVVSKADAHDRPPAPIMARGPFDTALALGTTRLLGRPIEREGIDPIALASAMLATIGAKRRTDDVKVMQGLGTGEELSGHIAPVEYMRARAQRALG